MSVVTENNKGKIPGEKIIKGNIMLARFRGLYYRDDWPNKYPEGYCITIEFKSAPIDAINDEMLLFVGNDFPYHQSWGELFECWMGFQRAWNENIVNEDLKNTSHSHRFFEAVRMDNLVEAWKELAIAAHWYLYKKFWPKNNLYLDAR